MDENAPFQIPDPGAGASLGEVVDRLERLGRADVVGAGGGAFAAAIARASFALDRPAVVVVADARRAVVLARDLRYHLARERPSSPERVLHFPAHETGPYDELVPDRTASLTRAGALLRLVAGAGWRALVVPACGMARRLLPRDRFESRCGLVSRGDRLGLEDILEMIRASGMTRSPIVEEPGTFAVRGGLADVFPPYMERPVRIEAFGDEVERIRSFDPERQSGGEEVDEVWIHPVGQCPPPAGEDELRLAAERVRAACDDVDMPTARTERLIEDLLSGRVFAGAEAFLPAIHGPLGDLASYLPDEALVCVEDPAAVRLSWERMLASLEGERARRRDRGQPVFDVSEHTVPWDRAEEDLSSAGDLLLAHRLVVEGAAGRPLERCDDPLDLASRGTEDLAERLRRSSSPAGDPADVVGPLARHLAALADRGFRVELVASTEGRAERLAKMLAGRGLDVGIGGRPDRPVSVAIGDLSRGCAMAGEGLCWIAEEEIFGRRTRRRAGPGRARAAFDDLRSLMTGDLVVHAHHGVGRYEGLVRQRIRGAEMDFLLVVYRDGDKLYLPVYRLDQVQKHRGGERGATLDKLGGQTFARSKAMARDGAAEMAARLLDLYSRRAAATRPPVDPSDDVYRAFEASFPFEETDDQARAIEEVGADLEVPRPMDRMVCGDVGFGKTEVALRAAFRVVMSGRQVAVLVPTTVLAQQHFQAFSERLAPYPIRVEVLSRFSAPAENAAVALGAKTGAVDVVVGTHRLLSKDVHFARLGLLVIDEEHRFGVRHKERIRALRASVDTMVLTATPIPRTLHMAFAGLRDLSLIATAPVDRRPIRTMICHDDPDLLGEAMRREIARGGQVFYVHNRVRGIERAAERARRLAPGARVAVAHGRMREEALERVMLDFVAGRYDVLVCTSIIESGLDIPRANTLVVERADAFGLAQLYQIRGRVGRSDRQAYAYLVVPPQSAMTDEARERVEALCRHTDLGSGFAVATLDMEIRGAGNLLGPEQSGSVAAVGFDMYCDLLAEATAALRGEERADEIEPEMSIDRPGLIPESYMPDVGQRLQYYKRLASAADEGEIEATAAEMLDRFGPLPEEAEEVIEGMRAKHLCRALGIVGLECSDRRATLHLGTASRVDPDVVLRLVREGRGRVRVAEDYRISVRFAPGEPGGVEGAIRFLRALVSYDNNPSIL